MATDLPNTFYRSSGIKNKQHQISYREDGEIDQERVTYFDEAGREIREEASWVAESYVEHIKEYYEDGTVIESTFQHSGMDENSPIYYMLIIKYDANGEKLFTHQGVLEDTYGEMMTEYHKDGTYTKTLVIYKGTDADSPVHYKVITKYDANGKVISEDLIPG